MKNNPIHTTTWKEIHDEFYQPELLRAEADAPADLRQALKPRKQAGKSTKPYQLPYAPKNGQSCRIKSKRI